MAQELSESFLRIVCVGYKNPDQILELIHSIQKNVSAPHELLIWDNGACREELAPVIHKNNWHNIKILGDGTNLGFAAAVNRSVENQGIPWTHLLLINPDAKLATPLTNEVMSRADKLNGIVGFQVFDDDEMKKRQPSARQFPSLITSIAGREGLLAKLWPNNPWTKKYLNSALSTSDIRQVDWVSGCALFSKRKDWEKLKGFDESYFLYVEDVDLGRKAQLLKIPVYFFPEVKIIHKARGSASKSAWRSDLYHHTGMWIYHIKWNGFWGLLTGPFVFCGIAARYLLRRVLH